MLSDWDITSEMFAGRIQFEPILPDGCFQPNSVDVTLGRQLIINRNGVDVTIEIPDEGYFLQPGEFALGCLAQSMTISARIAARIEGKSSNGRRGLGVHITAGFVDAGWSGVLTLELYNFKQTPFHLVPGMKIAQIAFDYLHSVSRNPYGSEGLNSHYQGAQGVEGAKA